MWYHLMMMSSSSVPTTVKVQLRWSTSTNNIRIKEEDKWKGAFTMHIGSFEPTVMFFGIMNSLV